MVGTDSGLTPYHGTAVSLARMAGLTIGKFAAAEGVSVETIRFYQRKGLLTLPERSRSGFREYHQADRSRLAFIRRARALGFTLSEIGELFESVQTRSAEDVSRAAEAKLAAIGEQIAELAALQCRLRRLVRVCEGGSRDDCVALHLREQDVASTAVAG